MERAPEQACRPVLFVLLPELQASGEVGLPPPPPPPPSNSLWGFVQARLLEKQERRWLGVKGLL